MRRLLANVLGGALGLGIALTPVAAAEAVPGTGAPTTSVVTQAAAKAKKPKKTKYPKPGQRGPKVKKLQRRLVKAGLLRKVTGKYRKGTKRAVRKFQRRQHIKVTGKVNARTWRLLVAATTPTRQPPPPPPPLAPAPLVVAHRGARVPGIPESSMAAMRYAADGGATVLEFDVRWTHDNVAVAAHDQSAASYTTCTGNISSHTWDQLTDCFIPGRPLTQVSEITDFARERGLAISPEIKKNKPTKNEAEGLTALIDGLPTYLQSFNYEAFAPMRDAGYAGPLVYLTTSANVTSTIATANAAGAAIVGQELGPLSTTMVAAYRGAGLRVWAWTATSTTTLARVRSYAVDAVVADDAPSALRFYAAQR